MKCDNVLGLQLVGSLVSKSFSGAVGINGFLSLGFEHGDLKTCSNTTRLKEFLLQSSFDCDMNSQSQMSDFDYAKLLDEALLGFSLDLQKNYPFLTHQYVLPGKSSLNTEMDHGTERLLQKVGSGLRLSEILSQHTLTKRDEITLLHAFGAGHIIHSYEKTLVDSIAVYENGLLSSIKGFFGQNKANEVAAALSKISEIDLAECYRTNPIQDRYKNVLGVINSFIPITFSDKVFEKASADLGVDQKADIRFIVDIS